MACRILYICFIHNIFSGLTQRTHHIIEDYLKRGNAGNLDVVYVANGTPDKDITIDHKSGVRYIGIRTMPSYGRPIPLGIGHIHGPLKMFITLIQNINEKYDYIIAESPWGGFVALLLRLIGRTNIIIYEDMDYFPGFYTKSKIRRGIIKWLEHIVIKNADIVITVGNELKELRQRHAKNKVYVIPNGVQYSLFSTAQAKDVHLPTLIYMGKLDDWAGVDLPIRALPKLLETIPDIQYLILGEGEEEVNLKKMAKELHVENYVRFLGKQKYEDLPKYLKEADIGIATFCPIPLMKYAFTLKVVEYGAAGLPVIATRIGETEQYIMQNNTGLLISYDVEEFIVAVNKLFREKNIYNVCAQNGIKRAKNLDWARILEERYQLLNKYLLVD